MARYKDLKNENKRLRMAMAAFAAKHHVEPGDVLIFKVGSRRYMNESFGVGYAAMSNIRTMLSETAGGPVSVLASVSDIDVKNLDRQERQKLRALLDQVDALAQQYPTPPAPRRVG